jgi:hypothetical protein
MIHSKHLFNWKAKIIYTFLFWVYSWNHIFQLKNWWDNILWDNFFIKLYIKTIETVSTIYNKRQLCEKRLIFTESKHCCFLEHITEFTDTQIFRYIWQQWFDNSLCSSLVNWCYYGQSPNTISQCITWNSTLEILIIKTQTDQRHTLQNNRQWKFWFAYHFSIVYGDMTQKYCKIYS